MKNNKTCSLPKTSVHKYTPEHPSSAFFSTFHVYCQKIQFREAPQQEQSSLKLFSQISSCFQVLLVFFMSPMGLPPHTCTLGLIWQSYLIHEYNTAKSSGGNHSYKCCYLIFSLKKSLCSSLEWPQDINIKLRSPG